MCFFHHKGICFSLKAWETIISSLWIYERIVWLIIKIIKLSSMISELTIEFDKRSQPLKFQQWVKLWHLSKLILLKMRRKWILSGN